MSERGGIFAGNDPFSIATSWLAEAGGTEPNDPSAMALATVDAEGLPDVRMVLLKAIDPPAPDAGFVFYTNYDSAKGCQIAETGVAAFVLHWKSLRRQVRVRGEVSRADGPEADAYYASRGLESRIGAWASDQSRPLDSRAALMARVAREGLRHGLNPPRPPFWGGFRIRPLAVEFWADGAFRLHDRFRWTRPQPDAAPAAGAEMVDGAAGAWQVVRLNP
ncbi:pyridoxamine 5'-phosphate oxidase [Paracoccus suum]|uniref:Pyridoxine/pyridoxamine 5'-phosphate oxidase n=1 Tax=Paracoccus suum TaxID=2259340 RepID=A0A344PKE1_9RHOB|nr:pyridoxamine 5'-phosphate oxidase [Paracoccus suum]AXC49846.1 pyridoxamine 5'-phosphate oxidase [Paracoccus suum]